MNIYVSRLEQLPNETLIDIFQYIDARNLFRAFHGLNFRFNAIIKSFRYLTLKFYIEDVVDNQIQENDEFSFYVYTLIIGRAINVDLSRFLNIHCLKLECPLKRVLSQLNSNVLPYLEHLTITQLGLFEIIDEWISLPSLRTLKISFITSLSYKTILTTCPNLEYLQFSLFTSDRLKLDVKPHIKLKSLVVEVLDMAWPWNDEAFDSFLSCVPNVESFSIYRTIFISKIAESLLEYDWLASKIALYLLSLRRFYFNLKIIQSDLTIEPNIKNIINQIEENFVNNHRHSYKSRHKIYGYQ